MENVKQFNVDDIKEKFNKKYPESLKTLQIEIRQQNENVRLYNLYLGFNGHTPMLHTVAIETKDEARTIGFHIIEMCRGLIPQITWETY
jgi:hypothetical protein